MKHLFTLTTLLVLTACSKDQEIDLESLSFYNQYFKAEQSDEQGYYLTMQFYQGDTLDFFYVNSRGDLLLNVVLGGLYRLDYPELTVQAVTGIDQERTTIYREAGQPMWFELDGQVFWQSFESYNN